MTTHDDNPTFRTLPASALAVVIEPRPTVADTVADCLRSRGYDVLVASSHSGAAASVIEREPVHILIAAVPAPGDDRSGAYLAQARATHPSMAIVIMLSDPDEPAENAPLTAVRLVKPFDKAALARSIDAACAIA